MSCKQLLFRSLYKLVLTLVLCFSLLCASGLFLTPTYAEDSLEDLNKKYSDLEERIKNREQKIKDAAKSITNNETSLATLKEQVSDLQEQIDLVNAKLKKLNAEITQLNNEIAALDEKITAFEAEIQKAQDDIDKRRQEMQEAIALLLERLRAAYLAGNANWLETIMGASDLSVLLTRTELQERVAKQDQKLIEKLEKEAADIQKKQEKMNADKQEVQTQREKVAQQRATVLAKKNDQQASSSVLKAKQDEIERKTTSITALILTLDRSSAAYQQEVAAMEAEQEAVEKQINEFIRNNGSSDKKQEEGDEAPQQNNNGKMIFPVPYADTYISAGYGYYSPFGVTTMHYGTDICVRPFSYGKKIVAVQDGTVILADSSLRSTYGKYIIIDHGNGLHTLYAHASLLRVSAGQKVKQGQHIADIGATGKVTGAHLHFEVRINRGDYVERVNAIPNYIPSHG